MKNIDELKEIIDSRIKNKKDANEIKQYLQDSHELGRKEVIHNITQILPIDHKFRNKRKPPFSQRQMRELLLSLASELSEEDWDFFKNA